MSDSRLGPFGENTVVCGDAIEIMAQLPNACIDLAILDPPYGINYLTGYRKYPSEVAQLILGDDDSIWEMWPNFIRELYRVMKDDAAVFIFTRWDQWAKLSLGMAPFEVKNMIVWDKGNWSAGDIEGNYGFAYELIMFAVKGRPKIRGRRLWNLWSIPRIPATQLRHPAEKPEKLIEIMIRSMSNVGDVVGDFFCGTGVVPLVADRLGRHFIAVDIEEKWVKMALEQLEKDRAMRQARLL